MLFAHESRGTLIGQVTDKFSHCLLQHGKAVILELGIGNI